MYGTSYSGFNSIQLAMERPPALKAIIPIFATDDRYADDVHYMGGAVKQLDQVDYPSYMVALNALPPVPGVYGEGWREEWERRVRGTEPWVLTWLEHQRFDDYWRFGSLRPDYDRIQAATMIIAGWADGYRNNSLRTFEQLRCPTRLVIGPWAHASTDTSLPGPNIDLVPEMIRWWDRWLKDEDNGIDREPPIVLFAQRSTRPGATRPTMEGEWRYEPTWPAERLRPTPLALADAHTDAPTDGERRRPGGPRRRRLDRVDLVRGRPAVGAARRPAAGRGVLAHLHVAGARARPGDPGARAADGVAHVVGPDRVPLGEALRRLPRRRLVAREPQHPEPGAPRLPRGTVAARARPAVRDHARPGGGLVDVRGGPSHPPGPGRHGLAERLVAAGARHADDRPIRHDADAPGARRAVARRGRARVRSAAA